MKSPQAIITGLPVCCGGLGSSSQHPHRWKMTMNMALFDRPAGAQRPGRWMKMLAAMAGALLFLFAPTVQGQGRWELNHGNQGYVPNLAAKLTPVGRFPATNRLRLAIGLPLHNQAQLVATLQDLWNPASPNYHHWLTPEQFTAAYGPTESEYQSVVHYLEAHGLKVETKYSNRALVSVSGAGSDIERTFGVTLRVYQHPTENRTFYAPDTVPSLDTNLPVLGISGLDSYAPPRHRNSARQANATTYKSSATGSGPGGNFLGDDYRKAYVPGVTLDGTGQTVALYDGQYYATNPIVYAQLAGRPVPNVTNVYLDGAAQGDPSSPANDSIETDLDLAAIIAMAPHAAILVYEGGNEDCLNQMALDNKAKQISTSISWSPASPMQNQEMEQFAAQGQSFFMASGDEGSNGDDNGNPWAPFGPLVTDVGGTSLSTSGAGGAWSSETTWPGSAGGVAVNMPIPSYQQGVSMAHNQGSTVFRNFPDVAIQAETDNTIVGGNGSVYTGWGGTSFASPMYAAFMALVNQQAAAVGNPPVGFLNPLIYAIGQSASYTADFHDITTGNNENSSFPGMFSAVPGYDLCTGWGSPHGQALINALAGVSSAPYFSLTVPGQQTAPPGMLTVSQGANATIVVTITTGNGFGSSVTLSAVDVPNGVTASFSPAGTTNASTLTFTASRTATITPNPVTVTIVGTGGGLTRTTTTSLNVVAGTNTAALNFSLAAAPGSVAVTPGGSSSSVLSIIPANGFTGSVSLTVTGMPDGVTAAFTLASTTTGSTLTFTADSGAAVGTNTITITATSGSLSQNTEITLLVLNPAQIAAPVIADFGFETPVQGTNTYQFNPADAAWTFGGMSPDGSGITANGSTWPNPNAPEGVQAAFLQEYGVISQAVPGFIPGINYTITFAAALRRPVYNGGETWNVVIDNGVIASYQPGATATNYTTYSASFTASAAVHTLAFTGTDLNGSSNTLFLDDVTITVSSNQFAAPSIALTSPASSTTLTAPAAVTLAASVVTNGNVINSVQFYANSNLISQVPNAPYTYAWNNLSNGNYNVSAQVVYNGGSVAASPVLSVTVTNPSANLGFEAPSIGADVFEYAPPGAAWTFSGSAAAVSGSGIVANGSTLGNPNAPEGVQAAFVREQGTLAQTLGGFTPGANYTVSYQAAQRIGSTQSWNVLIDNAVLQVNNGPGSTNYTASTFNFTASAAVHTLSFAGTDLAGGDNTVFLDNITVGPNENLGFETPAIGSGNYQYNPAGASWAFTGTSPSGAGIVANGSGFSNPNAPQGTQAAFIQEAGSISELVTGLLPGTNYSLTFWAAERGTVQNGGESWRVTMNGAVLGNFNPGASATAYVPYTVAFTALAATETLAFIGTDLAGGDNTVFIDNVQIGGGSSAAPAAPTGLVATAGSTQVSLSWNASSGAMSYNVQSATLPGGPYALVANVTGTNYLHTDLANGTTYYYVVAAVNASGAGTNSSQVSAIPQVPPPAFTSVVAGNAQVNLSWTPSSGAISYVLQSATVSGGPYSTVANITGTNYLQTGLSNGVTSYYVVWALNAAGPTAFSSQVTATPPGPALTIVADFGFETPTNASGAFVYDPTGGAWTFSGGSPSGSGLVANGSGFSNPNAPEGIQAAFVQEYGAISQAISGFTPGTTYQLSFLAAQRGSSQNGGESWHVTMNGTVVGNYSPGASATAYANYTATFKATVATETLAFVGTDAVGGDNTVFIDDVQLVPLSPQLTTNTLPVTAADVVGSQVTFTAGFSSASPAVYQWQMIKGGITNNLGGATNLSLTLTNLQLSNTASYQLLASSSYGTNVSKPASLTVSTVPAAVNNVITSLANQTGTGSGTFTPTWTVATNGSLIANQAPGSTSGNFSLEVPGRSVNSLTAGGSGGITEVAATSGYTTSTNYVTCGNAYGSGSLIVYPLAGSVSGYDLANITVYGGWADSGRDQQAYTVYYSTVAAPTTFLLLGTVNFLPTVPASVQSATRATLTPAAGVLATRVAAVEFNFSTPSSENGYCGYQQIAMFGTPSVQPVKWVVGNGNWDTSTHNWELLTGGSAVSYVENNLTAFDDSASGGSPIIITLTGNHSPSVITNNSAKNYTLAGGFTITGGNVVKDGTSTLTIDNGGANAFSSLWIKNGRVQVGNNDTNGSLGQGNVTNNGTLAFDRTDVVAISNLISGSGTVSQNGSGTLGLSAANSYTGSTIVGAGTVSLVANGTIAASALLAVSNGATLDVTGRNDQTLTLNGGQTLQGSGTINGSLDTLAGSTLNPGDTIGSLTVQGNITVNGSLVVELNRTNLPASDQLVAINGAIAATGALTITNVGPTLQSGDTFQLFNQPVAGFALVTLPTVATGYGWANNLANNGTITLVSTAPATLLSQVTGGNLLTLTWPANEAGWRLQVQSDSLAQGLGTNWVDVAGSTLTNQIAVPINNTNGSCYYRLVYP